ncbi:MAG: ABC transporter substrate-binding protein, partial [Clostridia bacterium]
MKKILAMLLSLVLLCSIASVGAVAEEVTFTFAAPFKISQWDPQNENKTMAYSLSKLAYNTLATLTADFQIEPELATEWSCSSDGLTWTFKLREDVKFHNGEPFNAD